MPIWTGKQNFIFSRHFWAPSWISRVAQGWHDHTHPMIFT